jgi:putative drug exporter of the RND superfamily
MATRLDKRAGARVPAPKPVPRSRWLVPALAIVAFIVIGGPLGSIGGKLSEIQRNDNAAYLPENAEATKVLAETNRFNGLESTPAILVYTRPDGATLTKDDQRLLTLAAIHLQEPMLDVLATPPIGPTISDDGKAADIILLLIGSDPNKLRPTVDDLRTGLADAEGYDLNVSGPAAAQTDLIEVYGKIDTLLLLVTALAVLLILFAVYRSPILPLVVLGVAGTGLGMANGLAYLLAHAGVYTITGQVQGILDVLVLGAGTDYALLLASRFREELRRNADSYQAMRAAWRASVEPIAASGGTVILALLCLLVSGLPATRSLGPVAAIGIGFAVLSMLVLLPAILVLLGRVAFWPFRPAFGSTPAESRGGWSRVAQWVGRRPRAVWGVTLIVMLGLGLGVLQLQSSGIPRISGFLIPVDSITGEQVLESHFPAASGSPTVILGRADHLAAMVAAVQGIPNITEVKPFVDPLEEFDNRQKGLPIPPPKIVDGLNRIDVTLTVPPDSAAAIDTVRAIRAAEHKVAGADATVGGYTASNVDVQDTSGVDRAIVIPLVLLLVFGILVLLLRAVIAPLLLIGTVILSYVATLGVCALVFNHIFGFAGSETSFPMYAFVFLVALGVDYNIFLMTRVREEVAIRGHREGTLAGLTVTGGVVTSAGVVVAATFAALAVIPLVYLAELAFAVAFGVLLDTFVVRTLLVPALTLDIGRFVWWPGKLRNAKP